MPVNPFAFSAPSPAPAPILFGFPAFARATVPTPTPTPAPAPVEQMTGLQLLESTGTVPADKASLAALQKSQSDEVKLVTAEAKAAGLSSKETTALINQIKAENKAELAAAKSSGTINTVDGKITSLASVPASANDKQASVMQSVADKTQQGIDFANQQNYTINKGNSVQHAYKLSVVADAVASGKSDKEAAQIASQVGVKHASEAVKIVKELTTAAPGEGEKLKEVKGGADLLQQAGLDPATNKLVYTTNKVGDGRTLTTAYVQDEQGNFREVGNTYQSINTKEGIGQIGGLLLGIAGMAALGPLGQALGGGLGGSIAAGGIVGGVQSAIAGGDVLKGIAGGALGGAFNTQVANSIGSNMVSSIEAQLAPSLGSQLANTVARAAASAALGAGQSAIAGTDVLTGAGLSALGSAVQTSVSNELRKMNLPPALQGQVANAASRAIATGVVAAAQGQDVGAAVGSSLISSGLQEAGRSAYEGIKTALTPTPTPAPTAKGFGADRVVGATSEFGAGDITPVGLAISGEGDLSPQEYAAALERTKQVVEGSISAVYVDPQGRRILVTGNGLAIEAGPAGSGQFVMRDSGLPINISNNAISSAQSSGQATTSAIDNEGRIVSSGKTTTFPATPEFSAPTKFGDTDTVGKTVVDNSTPVGKAAGSSLFQLPPSQTKTGISTADILRQAGLAGAPSAAPISAGPSGATAGGGTTSRGATDVTGGVSTGGGQTIGGAPSGVPSGVPGGAGGASTGGVRGAEMAPPVDVPGRVYEMAPPVEVTERPDEMAPPVEVTPEPEPIYNAAEGKTTYFGEPPSPTPTDKTLVTFLGLTPPAVPKPTKTTRTAQPGLIAASDESDLSALFGGKPEELQDVWNQSSLRLRSALGI